ncbi:trypsin-1-like [Parasteatoda tepidariorum]|uniref:trypsin-1-like n=1 Tax=Parasteatoda tepidariorum TaxID=114398 RepID=UPI0039BC2D27
MKTHHSSMFLGYCLVILNFYINAAKSEGEENPSMEKCGISKTSASDNKIVGGRNALQGEFPWQLSFQMRILPMLSSYEHICGASVINKHWAVTAAHCIAGGYFTTYRVAAGVHNITTRTLPTNHRVIPIVHEGYNPMTGLKNDIALLRLMSPMNMEEAEGLITGVCLPSRDMADNTTGIGTVTGWGTTSQGGKLSETLQAVDIPILNDTVCQEVYGDLYENTMLCAGYEEGGRDSCQGDSGGPFVQRSENGVSTLIGIVSFGRGCAQPKYPGVYTEVSHYMDWIVRTMNSLNSS